MCLLHAYFLAIFRKCPAYCFPKTSHSLQMVECAAEKQQSEQIVFPLLHNHSIVRIGPRAYQ